MLYSSQENPDALKEVVGISYFSVFCVFFFDTITNLAVGTRGASEQD